MSLRLQDSVYLRQDIIYACQHMTAFGLNQGTSGNISVRVDAGVLVTPSGVPYDKLLPDMLQVIPDEGTPDMSGEMRPTSEWRFHQAILRARPDLVSVVHAHPVHSTAVAIQRRAIPACHYMVAAFGGNDVPLVDYSLFGGEDLAQGVAAAMAHRSACILANHGAIAAGETLDKAMWRMQELETLAQMYLLSQIGADPVILSEQNIKDAVAAFANYGPRTVPKT